MNWEHVDLDWLDSATGLAILMSLLWGYGRAARFLRRRAARINSTSRSGEGAQERTRSRKRAA